MKVIRRLVRLGDGTVRTITADLARQIDAGRPYRTIEDVVRRNTLTTPQTEALATAGTFSCFGESAALPLDRRSALWSAGALAQAGRPDRLPGIVTGDVAPDLPVMHRIEVTAADLWSTGIAADASPTEFVHSGLDERGVVTSAGTARSRQRARVWVAGVVTHRQRPATASGTTFVNLEDGAGLINVICSKGVWTRYRKVARSAPALLIRGTLEKVEGTFNVVADRIEALSLATTSAKSRDFR